MSRFSSYLFWDVDESQFCIHNNKTWLIKRVLEKGIWKDWLSLNDTYTKVEIVESLKSMRSIDKKAANFACAFYQIKKDELRCYSKKQSQNTPWSY